MFDLQLSRIVMPFTVEEYQIGQLWSVIESSSRETGGGDGVEILVNEPFSEAQFPDSIGEEFSTGQYTKKRYYLKSKLNGFVRTLLPNSAMILEEIAWNAYPYCKTVITVNFPRLFL
ncbi:unnamed protein product [Orchesella dallaii]|uniref:Phosphatidylinositol transfer protein N-terminal domain-containing protein n=1 Tax=Orchesella dallaii TaxID=48710 RepID=A0ABP1PVP4_9HEXA